MPRSVKIAPEIDAKLYQELVSVAKENGQSRGLFWSGRCSIACSMSSPRSGW